MMKIKFNKFERVAGVFVLAAIVGSAAIMVSVAVKQGWFDPKVKFTATFESADGIHPGTMVQMAGLKAGSVDSVDLLSTNRIQVSFYVLSKFQERVRRDSRAQLIRPFIIGERVLDISVGSDKEVVLKADSSIPTTEAVDLMTILSGRKLGPYLETLGSMVTNLKSLAEAFLDKDRTENFIRIFDKIDPLMKNLNTMSLEVIKLSKQATHDENLKTVLGNLSVTTSELNDMLPAMKEKAPSVAKDLESVVRNLAVLTQEFKVVLPALAAVAPDLPHASRRAVEALDEAVVLIKAMQKSMFMRGSVQEVREEEETPRKPASKDK
jgi:phospholipid/cholesterol/gamma-HCH transport system substrate-binding protein